MVAKMQSIIKGEKATVVCEFEILGEEGQDWKDYVVFTTVISRIPSSLRCCLLRLDPLINSKKWPNLISHLTILREKVR